MLPFPGTDKHQTLLQSIVSFYEVDPRVRAVIAFGSLGRGNWDAWSDIDLDVIIADDVELDARAELSALCASFEPLGERAAVIVPDDEDAGDVVLESLMQMSVRYHVLADTSPAIVASMRVLTGELDDATIAAAGLANQSRSATSPEQLLDACVRYAAVANVYIQRGSIWLAVEILHRLRTLLMQIFTLCHGYERPFHAFASKASAALQARLGATLPSYDISSLRMSLEAILDMLQDDLDALSAGRQHLSQSQQVVLAGVRQQLAPRILPET